MKTHVSEQKVQSLILVLIFLFLAPVRRINH